MKSKIIFIITFLFFGIVITLSCSNENKKETALYTCPMHPEVRKSEPGQCPVCKMDLEKTEEGTHLKK